MSKVIESDADKDVSVIWMGDVNVQIKPGIGKWNLIN